MRIWLSLFFITTLLTSCGKYSGQASPPLNQSDNVTRIQSANNEGSTGDRSRQSYLEHLVSKVPGVKGAHCVIMGKTAIVGIDVDSKLERARVGSIKYTVAEVLRKDPQGTGAIVTADMDLNQRLIQIGNQIQRGRPIEGFANELAEIIGRVVPQMPNDTHPSRNENQTQQPAGQTQNNNNPGQGTKNVTPRQMKLAPDEGM